MTQDSLAERARAIADRLRAWGDGVHQLEPPATVLDTELPPAVAAVYRELGGGTLFFEALMLEPPAELREQDGRWQVGAIEGDPVWVDAATGTVWRSEEASGEELEEGTSFERWLAGFVDAEATLYDSDGEYRDGVFDDAGELLPAAVIERERAALKRDRHAVAPRWRLARALARQGDPDRARGELERVVERAPGFAWAWYDLARLAEQVGDVDAAQGDMRAAAEAGAAGGYAAFFWAHAARIAASAGDEARRADAAARAVAADPGIARAQVAGARDQLESGDTDAARELARTAAAVAPRDLDVLDLLRTLG